MIGAGSGIAPMTSIMRLASARQSTVPMALLCSNRERASVLLSEPLEELDRHADPLSVTHTFTRSPWDPSARYHRHIEAPMIDDVIEELALRSPAPQSVLIAGPPAMVTSVRAALATLGIGGLHQKRAARVTWRNVSIGQETTYRPRSPKRDWTGRQSEPALIY